jgi:hypothetical protein
MGRITVQFHLSSPPTNYYDMMPESRNSGARVEVHC